MADDSIPPRRLKWRGNRAKREDDAAVNTIICRELGKRKKLSCLTMPAGGWVYERDLAERMKSARFEFHGLERARDVYQHARIRALHLSLPSGNAHFLPEHCRLLHFLHKSNCSWESAKFDLVYPDWMGSWAQEKYEEVCLMFDRRIFKRKAFLRTTMMLARGQKGSIATLAAHIDRQAEQQSLMAMVDRQSAFAIADSKNGIEKLVGLTGLVAERSKANGYTSRLVRACVYKDRSSVSCGAHVTPEISMLFQINEN